MSVPESIPGKVTKAQFLAHARQLNENKAAAAQALSGLDGIPTTVELALSQSSTVAAATAQAVADRIQAEDLVTGATLEQQIEAERERDRSTYGPSVNHGASAGAARPVSALPVSWSGTVAPTKSVNGDRWYDESTELLKRKVGGAWVAAGSTAYTALGAARGSGRQKVKSAIKPVLHYEKLFPGEKVNHQVTNADTTTGVLWSLGVDGAYRRSASDAPVNWLGRATARSGADLWAWSGVDFVTLSGAHLVLVNRSGTHVLIRSTDNRNTWTDVLTFANGDTLLGPQGICEDPANPGHVYLAIYNPATLATAGTFQNRRSTDSGATWAGFGPVFNRDPAAAGAVRHAHAVQPDTDDGTITWMLGDGGWGGSGCWRNTPDNSTMTAALTDDQATAQGFPNSSYGIGMMFFPPATDPTDPDFGKGPWIAYGQDGSSTAYLFRFRKNQIGQSGGPALERGPQINSTAWWTQLASDPGEDRCWVVSGSNEDSGNGTPIDGLVHLYAVRDRGRTMDEVLSVPVSGQAGISSLAPMGQRSGGKHFWLRLFNGRRLPFPANDSGLQIKCWLGWGDTPVLCQPEREPHGGMATYGGTAVLAAGETRTVDTLRAPAIGPSGGMTRLYVGNARFNASDGAGKLQLWNSSTGTQIGIDWTSRDYKNLSGEEAACHVASYAVPVNSNVDVRLVNTSGTNPATLGGRFELAWGH